MFNEEALVTGENTSVSLLPDFAKVCLPVKKMLQKRFSGNTNAAHGIKRGCSKYMETMRRFCQCPFVFLALCFCYLSYQLWSPFKLQIILHRPTRLTCGIEIALKCSGVETDMWIQFSSVFIISCCFRYLRVLCCTTTCLRHFLIWTVFKWKMFLFSTLFFIRFVWRNIVENPGVGESHRLPNCLT